MDGLEDLNLAFDFLIRRLGEPGGIPETSIFEPCNFIDPKISQQYTGWQEDGEWTNYTVDVKVAGQYRVIAVYSNKDNGSSLWLNCELALLEQGNYCYFCRRNLWGRFRDIMETVHGILTGSINYSILYLEWNSAK